MAYNVPIRSSASAAISDMFASYKSKNLRLVSDSISAAMVEQPVTFEPIARQLMSSLVVGLRENFDLDPNAFANMLMREGSAVKLSECIDGRMPLARIRLDRTHSALVAVNSDRKSGTLQVDFYYPPSSELSETQDPFCNISLFTLKEYLHHITDFLYNSADMEEQGLHKQSDIVKFKYISPDLNSSE